MTTDTNKRYLLPKNLLPDFWIKNWDEKLSGCQWNAYISNVGACITLERNDSASLNFKNTSKLAREQVLDFTDWLATKGWRMPVVFIVLAEGMDFGDWMLLSGDQEWLRAQFSIQVCRTRDGFMKRIKTVLGEGFDTAVEVEPKEDKVLSEEISRLLASEKVKLDSNVRQILNRFEQALLKADGLELLRKWEQDLATDYEKLMRGEA